MSAEGWYRLPGSPDSEIRRRLRGLDTLSVFRGTDDLCRWEFFRDGKVAGTSPEPFPSLEQAREAADLWASEHGYPTVRVEVDP